MPSRRELKGIVNDIISSLNSRNNDYLGYWATGQFYKLALENNTKTVKLDILNKTIFPNATSFFGVIGMYTDKITKHLHHRNIPIEFFREVIIEYDFEQEIDKKLHPYIGVGNPYTIKFIMGAESGGTYTRTVGGYCRPHDPKKEQRRYGF